MPRRGGDPNVVWPRPLPNVGTLPNVGPPPNEGPVKETSTFELCVRIVVIQGIVHMLGP